MRVAFMLTAIDAEGMPVHLARVVVELEPEILDRLAIDPEYAGAYPITMPLGRAKMLQTTSRQSCWLEAEAMILPTQRVGIRTVDELDDPDDHPDELRPTPGTR